MPIHKVNSKLKIVNGLHSIYHLPFTLLEQRKRLGFTLIELLIVITIIGILATFVVASFTSAQQKARDARRKSDLNAIKKALTFYSSNCLNGLYPHISGGAGANKYISLQPYLVSGNYMKTAPQDPRFVSFSGTYKYEYDFYGMGVGPFANSCPDASGALTIEGIKTFRLEAKIENASDPEIANSYARCPGVTPIAQYIVVCSD